MSRVGTSPASLGRRIRSLGWVFARAVSRAGRHRLGHCVVCGCRSLLLHLQDNPRESFVCAICRGSSRNRHLVKVLLEIVGESVDEPQPARVKLGRHMGLAIYEAQASGTVNRLLKGFPRYACSEYFESVPPGERGPGGILCEDLQRLNFPDDAFDVVITQDVLEHVRDPDRVLREIRRVLVPGGFHVYSVPIDETRSQTICRVDVSGPVERALLPEVFHLDGVREGGSLVYNDFGLDLLNRVDAMGMNTARYRLTAQMSCHYGIYDSTVYVSRKT